MTLYCCCSCLVCDQCTNTRALLELCYDTLLSALQYCVLSWGLMQHHYHAVIPVIPFVYCVIAVFMEAAAQLCFNSTVAN
jgi:hypothetical protein